MTEDELMQKWEFKMIPYTTSDHERKVLSESQSSWAGRQYKGFLKSRYMKMVGIVEDFDGTYHPDWKQEYIQLKGWENMTDFQKSICSYPVNSHAATMGQMAMKKELERIKAEVSQDNG